jgi:hypothetical protein
MHGLDKQSETPYGSVAGPVPFITVELRVFVADPCEVFIEKKKAVAESFSCASFSIAELTMRSRQGCQAVHELPRSATNASLSQLGLTILL